MADLAPDSRVAANDVRRVLTSAARASGERSGIGLRVGRMVERGETGAIDYVAASAATLADAIAVTARNFRLVNDAVSVSVLRNDDHVLVRFDARVPWDPFMGEYLLSSIFTNHLRKQVGELSRVEVWFAHPEPNYRDEYQTTFAPSQVRFDAACYGFRLPVTELERPQRDADPHLHQVLRKHVAQLMIEQPNFTSFEGRVTQVLSDLLDASQPPTARQVASRLEISTRTLARRLEAEGTTFYEVLDRLRQRLAVDYVRCTKLAQCDVSARLGFAHAAAFHRAFKRWTGTTPAMLRKAHEQRQA
ncbi:MAG: AraC family transcriptional regulator ligand-binding domain-containing protein [Polyangiales bacterium]